jgi:hypothetical protein
VWPTAHNGTLDAECLMRDVFLIIGDAMAKPIAGMAQTSSAVQLEHVQLACFNATIRDALVLLSYVTDSMIVVITRTK